MVTHHPTNPNLDLTQFMAEFSRTYIASGGPTSRLEDALSNVGNSLGHKTEIFATPTGVFVNTIHPDGSVSSKLCRIKEGGTNLEKLCWLESILDDVLNRKITPSQAIRILNSNSLAKNSFTSFQRAIAAFIAGFALSFLSYANIKYGFISGIIGSLTWLINGPLLDKKISSSIFRDFIGCTVTLSLAALAQFIIPAPFEAYTIGGIVILVPGLALTNAIAELADQNLVSGTSKLMQAIFTLLALGLAYLLFSEIASSIDVEGLLVATSKTKLSFWNQFIFIGISISCFGVILRVPKKSLFWSTLVGLLGWLVLHKLNINKYSVTSPFLTSLLIGIISLFLSKKYKIPSQVFSVPGIIAMLPGMMALTSIQSFALGKESAGIEISFRVAQTAASIAFGLFAARIPFALKAK